MTMFFKRLSRSRGNSYTQDDDSYERVPSVQQQGQQQQQQQQGEAGPPSSYRRQGQYQDTPPSSSHDNSKMYNPRTSHDSPSAPYSSAPSGQQQPQQQQQHQRTSGNGMGTMNSGRDSGYVDATSPSKQAADYHSAPDLLTRAFNEAVRPFTDRIDHLEQQIADMQVFVEQLEQQRMDIFSWIDKRGLRPDVPPAIAKQMDSSPDAAASLNAQLDRKITIVNFDLHRLQDDLNDSISSAHFASAMAKFLPDIQRLARLPSGPRYAYELVIKLVGNLNSHGGLEASAAAAGGAGAGGADGAAGGAGDEEIEEDRRARAAFYDRMDAELAEIVRRRSQEGEDWQVSREVKRLEKNAAYLKNLGIEPYFPRSLDYMRSQAEFGGQGSGQGHSGMMGHGGHGGHGASTPPRYQ